MLQTLDSFSIIHAKAYSYIGFQTLYLSKHWSSIFWNTACLIINSGSLEEEKDENETEEEKKKSSTDYAKISQAIAEIRKMGVQVSLVNINTSGYSFKPDVTNNTIRYGLKGLSGVGDDVIEQIISNRPYKNIADFMNKCKLTRVPMISLIKAGAFDDTDGDWAREIYPVPRVAIMAYYLDKICDKKSRITLQNFNTLYKKNLIAPQLAPQIEVYFYNKFLKDNCKTKEFYRLAESSLQYFATYFDTSCLIDEGSGSYLLPQKTWEKFYTKAMDPMRDWMRENQSEILNSLNQSIFMDEWAKYAYGTIPAWEMKSLGFYYTDHELSKVNQSWYGITRFDILPENPVPIDFKGKFPIYDIAKIMGTVIAKNKDKNILTIATVEGNVNVKFSKEYFAMINRKITEPDETGKQKTIEEGWTTKGTKLLINGYRREDTFVAKSYSGSHTVYKITNVSPDGTIDITHARAGMEEEND